MGAYVCVHVCACACIRACACILACVCVCVWGGGGGGGGGGGECCHSSYREDIICEGTKSAGKLHTAAEHKQASCLTHTKSVHNTTDQ